MATPPFERDKGHFLSHRPSVTRFESITLGAEVRRSAHCHAGGVQLNGMYSKTSLKDYPFIKTTSLLRQYTKTNTQRPIFSYFTLYFNSTKRPPRYYDQVPLDRNSGGLIRKGLL